MNGSSGDKYVDICSEIPLVSDVSAIASTLVVADIVDFTVCHTACTPWSSDIVTCTVAVIKKKRFKIQLIRFPTLVLEYP